MRYKVRPGATVNHNSKLYLEGEIIGELPPHVAADAAVAGSVEPVVEDKPVASVAEKVKGE